MCRAVTLWQSGTAWIWRTPCLLSRCSSQSAPACARWSTSSSRRIGAEPKIAYETEEDQVVAGLVAQGFGIGIVPYMELLLRLDVKIIQLASPSWERNFYMISQRGGYMSPAVANFRKYVLDTCSDYIGQHA